MNRCMKSLLVAVGIAVVAPLALARSGPPKVDAGTGAAKTQTKDGWKIACKGPACMRALALWGYDASAKRGTTKLNVNHDYFCRSLAENRPPLSYCGATVLTTGLPLVPGVKGYKPQGCAAAVTRFFTPEAFEELQGWTGDANQPLKGVDFTAACAEHERCYFGTPREPGAQYRCDNAFYEAMQKVCVIRPSWQKAACMKFAQLYHAAAENFGITSWNGKHITTKCRSWGEDMKRNHCGP